MRGYIGPRQTILVVDDNEIQRELIRELLTPLGFQHADRVDGAECLALAEQNKPNLILLDIAMPEMDGWEVARRLRRHRASAPPSSCCRRTPSIQAGMLERSACTTIM